MASPFTEVPLAGALLDFSSATTLFPAGLLVFEVCGEFVEDAAFSVGLEEAEDGISLLAWSLTGMFAAVAGLTDALVYS